MQFRDFGKTGEKVSALGFGLMRLPTIAGVQGSEQAAKGNTDVKASVLLIRTAIEAGLNYLDTAYYYMGGFSEQITPKFQPLEERLPLALPVILARNTALKALRYLNGCRR